MARKGKSFSLGLPADGSPPSPYQRSAVEQGMAPASEWDVKSLPEMPVEIDVPAARKLLNTGFDVIDPRGQNVRFDTRIISHWQKNGYDEKQIDGRLTRLDMARESVKTPAEIWQQYNQIAYVQVFVKPTGARRGCVVFVRDNGVETYFPKDLKAMEKVRKGLLIKGK